MTISIIVEIHILKQREEEPFIKICSQLETITQEEISQQHYRIIRLICTITETKKSPEIHLEKGI